VIAPDQGSRQDKERQVTCRSCRFYRGALIVTLFAVAFVWWWGG